HKLTLDQTPIATDAWRCLTSSLLAGVGVSSGSTCSSWALLEMDEVGCVFLSTIRWQKGGGCGMRISFGSRWISSLLMWTLTGCGMNGKRTLDGGVYI